MTWQKYKKLIESILPEYIDTDELVAPIKYTLLSGGKRFRASLCYLVAELFGAPLEQAHSSSVALECIHTYSLIHDDLPAMDNDDLRRGQPTCHKRFDEATAILAGDGLQTLAFRVLAEDKVLDHPTKVRLISLLGRASYDMVRGQQLDIYNTSHTLQSLTQLHTLKTGALLTASILMAGVIAQVSKTDYTLLERIGGNIGLAYQVQDDVLECLDTSITGKSASDRKNDKTTFASLMGINEATKHYKTLYEEALSLIAELSVAGNNLTNLIKIMQNRNF